MICCSKCKQNKSIDQYDTYWHSTQKKTRMRKYCKSCFLDQKRQYREMIRNKKITQPVEDMTPPERFVEEVVLPPIVEEVSTPIIEQEMIETEETFLCSKCEEYKTSEHYYFNKRQKDGKRVYRSHLCRDCAKKESTDRHIEQKKENGGSRLVPEKVGVYFDEFQRENTYELMTLLGYLLDEPTGLWWKPGYKHIVDGKPVFLKLKKYEYKTKPLTPNEVRWIIKYREEGMRLKEIAQIMGRSIAIIHNKLKQYENSK